MINWIIDQLFKWNALRTAIFAEVDFYNSITLTLEDPESMKIATALWDEGDGWRGWTVRDNGSYYFNDVPEKSLNDMFYLFEESETV